MVNERKDKIFQNGKCVVEEKEVPQSNLVASAIIQVDQKQSSWWSNAKKSLFDKKEPEKEKQKDNIFDSLFKNSVSKEGSVSEAESNEDSKKGNQIPIILSALVISLPEQKDSEFVFLCLQYSSKLEILKITIENRDTCNLSYTLRRNVFESEPESTTGDLSQGQGYFKSSNQSA